MEDIILSFVRILSQTNPVHVIPSSFCNIHFNIADPSTPRPSTWQLFQLRPSQAIHLSSHYLCLKPHSSLPSPPIWSPLIICSETYTGNTENQSFMRYSLLLSQQHGKTVRILALHLLREMFMASVTRNKNDRGTANKQFGVGLCRFTKHALHFETSLSVADISHHITSHHNTSHYITSQHNTTQHITTHNITLHHNTSHYITSQHITLHHITTHHIRSQHITSHHITSHHNKSHHITTHYITSQHITPHYITSQHFTSQHIPSHHITTHPITSQHIPSHHITSHLVRSAVKTWRYASKFWTACSWEKIRGVLRKSGLTGTTIKFPPQ
jgi:hypothetical protein